MPLDKEETKEAMKEAIKEWLDQKFATFGKWSAMGLGAAIFFGIIYFLAWVNGFHKQ